MGLGVLDSSKLDNVPGTATLNDLLGGRVPDVQDGVPLKRAVDGTILVPQPSDDPDDPLNWPLWRRDMITFFLCLLSVLASTLSPLLAANSLTLLTYYGGKHSITDIALLTGYHLLGVAISGFFVVPLARVWGKRWLVLLGTLIIIVSCIWAGFSGKNYNSLVAARFFQGIGLAPFEGLVNVMVGEIYFVHESGPRMALTNLCLFGGAFFTPVIVGKTTASLGWQWTFWLVAIFSTAIFPVVYLFCPETTYIRNLSSDPRTLQAPKLTMDPSVPVELRRFSAAQEKRFSAIQSHTIPDLSRESGTSSELKPVSTLDRTNTLDLESPPQAHVRPRTKLITKKSLALFTGRKTDESFIKLALRPLPLFAQPAFLWAALTQGALIAWVTLLGISLALYTIQVGFNEVQTGYMYAGAFVGAVSAFVLAGLISDPSMRLLTRLNNGVFEPEFRMILVIPMMIFGIGGLFGYGYATTDVSGWLVVDVFFGMVVGGMTLGAVVSAQYLVDGYRDLTIEGFTCLLMFKNFIAFGGTYQGFEWYQSMGPRRMFSMFAYIQLAIGLSAIPMYIYGKRVRSFFARHDLLELLHLR